MVVKGRVFKYGDNVDTDVIIPARYLNIADVKELSSHAMEDIDTEFVNRCGNPEFWLRFLPRARSVGTAGKSSFLCHCDLFCAYFLPECDQYWASNP